MNRRRFYYLLIGLLAAGLLLAGGGSVQAQEAELVSVSYPTEGAALTGLVTVTGTVTFPDFLKYEIFLKSGDRLIWAATVFAPVVNGNLARLDTRTFVNDAYQIVVRQVRENSQYVDFLGPTISINNPEGSPNKFPEIESNLLYPADDRAVVRVRNCSGEDFSFDYGSPTSFRDSGQIMLPAKPEEGICPYSDIALKPAEYRGTGKGGAQVEAVTYSFMAEAGKLYQVIYNGPAAGANQLYIGPIEADKRASTDTAGSSTLIAPGAADSAAASSAAAAPTPIPTAPLVLAAAPAPTAVAPVATQEMLPVSGREETSAAPYIVAGVSLILALIGGGVMATRRQGSRA